MIQSGEGEREREKEGIEWVGVLVRVECVAKR